jgi:hypothetical protein
MTDLAQDLLIACGLADGDLANIPLWQPIDDSPQERAYNSESDVIGYGGAGGGGKSYLILGFAFTKHKRSRIFRRTFKSLQGLIDDGDKILSGRTRFTAGKGWRFDGRVVMAGYIEHDKDWEKWKGDRVDLMAFDEADQFPQHVVESMSGWNGTTDPHQKTRLLLCFNPPSGEGEWLIDYFAPWINDKHPNPAEDGEIRYFIRNDADEYETVSPDDVVSMTGYEIKKYYEALGKTEFRVDTRRYNMIERDNELIEVQSRTFFKARVDDNPYAMMTGYDRRLAMLPEPLRSQLRYGDFSIGRPDDDWQVIPTEWITRAQERWALMDAPKVKLRAIGVDPSRGGKDNFVIAPLRATYFDELIVHEGKSIPKVKGGQYGARLVMQAIGNSLPIIGVDADGIGSSVYDSLLDYPQLKDIVAINSGSAGYGTDKSETYTFNNLRSMMWWMFREALDPESGIYIALPSSRTLRNELRAPTYSTRTGRIQVERKDEIRKRIGRSTDYADAVIYAWYVANAYKKSASVMVL